MLFLVNPLAHSRLQQTILMMCNLCLCHFTDHAPPPPSEGEGEKTLTQVYEPNL